MKETVKRTILHLHRRAIQAMGTRFPVRLKGSLFVDGGAVAGEAREDLVGGLVPDEWLGVLVPVLESRMSAASALTPACAVVGLVGAVLITGAWVRVAPRPRAPAPREQSDS